MELTMNIIRDFMITNDNIELALSSGNYESNGILMIAQKYIFYNALKNGFWQSNMPNFCHSV